jgi:hypothetical protein
VTPVWVAVAVIVAVAITVAFVRSSTKVDRDREEMAQYRRLRRAMDRTNSRRAL